MNETALRAVIEVHCKELCVSSMLREYTTLAREAREGEWSYEEFFRQLIEVEVRDRRDRSAERRIREAHFPDRKTLDQLDWKALNGISKPKVMELATCHYLEQGDDVVFAGPIGTGKTHLAIALGMEAARRRHRVVFTRAADLVRSLMEARNEHILSRLHKRYLNVALLIVDELGFVPFNKLEGELLFNLLADRYERCSTMVTTNLQFGEWVQVFGCEKLTTALLDRLVHHAQIFTTQGTSYRTRKKGGSLT